MSKIKILKLLILGLVIALLSSCGDWEIELVRPTIYNAGFSTNYTAQINGNKKFIICDNKTTNLKYHFNYTGDLTSWSSFLEGATTHTVKGSKSFGSANITDRVNRYVEVIYGIGDHTAPLSIDPIATTGITPVPTARVIGHTLLHIKANGWTTSRRLISSEIPVVSNCP